jgi:hypothetical protein
MRTLNRAAETVGDDHLALRRSAEAAPAGSIARAALIARLSAVFDRMNPEGQSDARQRVHGQREVTVDGPPLPLNPVDQIRLRGIAAWP